MRSTRGSGDRRDPSGVRLRRGGIAHAALGKGQRLAESSAVDSRIHSTEGSTTRPAYVVVWDMVDRERAEVSQRRAHDELEQRLVARTRELAEARVRLSEANARCQHEHEKLHRAEKLSSLGLLASGVVHELNNPLAGVTSLVKTLRDGRVLDGRRDEYFATICDGLERMRLIVHGMLDFARMRQSSHSEFVAADMVQSCMRLIAPVSRIKDIRVEVVMPAGFSLCADRPRIMQAVVNVLMNGVHAAPERSTITISTVDDDDDLVGLRIADQGAGIAKEDISKIGEPFYTTKAEGEGTGLGLAITRDILSAHGGSLTIESVIGQGTAVTLWLARVSAMP
jgi:signal transduction histidine kinase